MSDFEKKYYDLLNLVADMRVKQKKYFRMRTSTDLRFAKNAEEKIDNVIKEEVLKIENMKKIQTELFPK